MLLQVSGQGLERPFVALVVHVSILIVHKFFALFVQTEICQMRVHSLLGRDGVVVLVDGEAHQPLIVDVNAPGLQRRDHHVEAQVELEPVNEQRVLDVA